MYYEVWLAAGRELGYDVKDTNGPQQISFAPIEASRRFGRRVSSYKGYIEPILSKRGNLRIITNAFATEILFSKDGTTAIGVRYNLNGTNPQSGNVAFAKREVIVSAGAYGSPLLLMRSGIGPREVLESAGIPQIKELPVGENFQGHPRVPLHIILNNQSLSYDPKVELNPENFELWKRFGLGPYADVNGFAGQCFLASSVAAQEGHPEWADIQLTLSTRTTLIDQFKGNYIAPWETSVQMSIYVRRLKSRGTVKLNPKDINGPPIIDFNYLSDKRDEVAFLDSIRYTLKIFEGTEAYQRYGARIFYEPLPVCKHLLLRSDEYWRCYIVNTMQAGNHPSSTCSMNSVVDSKLRVRGIRKLIVADAAVLPVTTNANLQAVLYGIAEKISDQILNEQSGSSRNQR